MPFESDDTTTVNITLASGAPVIVAGPNITVNTSSVGSVEITGSAGGGGYWASSIANNIFTTGSIDITGSAIARLGFSGSLTTLADGSPYILAGPGIIVNSSSNGAISISSSVVIDPIYWTSTVSNIIETTGSVVLSSGNLVATGSIIATTGFTGSLFGTASYASNSLTASYVLQAVSSSYASTASYVVSALTASYLVDTGFSGSLTRLKDGTPYLLAGPNVTINTASNGSIEISGSQASYWTSNVAGNIFTTGSAVIYNGLTITGSLVQGSDNVASGIYSHAEGWFTTASAPYSHAEGYGSSVSISTATGSHVEGYLTIASAQMAHAEGRATTAEGHYSHAEGYNTITIGQSSHAEGYLTITYGSGSHVEGSGSIAYGNYSHAEGIETIASGSGQLTIGKYNKRANDYSLFVIGDGTGSLDNQRHDFVLVNSGSTPGAGTVIVSGSVVSTLGFIGSLFGTASYASTASYVVSALTASYLVDTGFSGSITKLKDGTPYLLAGTNITITTNSNGAIAISSSQADLDVNYWISNVAGNIFATGSVDITGSLYSSGSIGTLTGFTGSLLGTASYATQATTASYALQAVSASFATNALTASYVLQAVSSSYASYAVTASQAGVATNALNANTASYVLQAVSASYASYAVTASQAGVATNALNANTASYVLQAVSASYASYAVTASQAGVATNALNANTASYVLQAVSASYASYAVTASQAGVATNALNANTASYVLQAVSSSFATSTLTASYLIDTGFSGSLTRLKDGTPYLLAGPNITITTSSNGSIEISGSQVDLDPIYWTSNIAGNIFTTGSVDITGSLVASGSIVALTGFTGSLLGTSSYSTQSATASYVLQAVSASYAYTASLAGIATSSLNANTASYLVDTGFSGSLTRLKDGTPYLLAGPNITITTSSNGSIQISGSQIDIDPIYWTSNVVDNIFTTGSVDITGSLVASGSIRSLTGFTGSLLGTASYATQATTASYVLQAVSASFATSALTASYVLQAVSSSYASYAVTASQAGVATNALNANTASYVLQAVSASYASYALTASQAGVATNALNANTASYVLQAVSASYASYALTASQAGVATNALNANTASYLVDTGFSGSITKLKDGTSYLLAGPNITITTNSNGAVAISASLAGATNYWQSNVAANIFTTGSVDITGSLVASGSIRALTGFTGSLLGTASYATQAATASYVLQAVSASYASTASYVVSALTASYLVDTGFSGSITRLKDGTPYLLAGPNITLNTASNGAISISGSGVYAPNIGWTTAFEIDFATFPSQNLTGSAGTIFNGIQFEFSNSGNANWVGPSASLGFAINSKATSTELLDSVRTAPLVNIILTNLIGDYHPDDFDVRVWAQVTHNATNSVENYFLGFERVPAAAPYERMHIIRGYDTAQSTNMAVCYNNITANSTKITSSIELADNTQVVSLDKWTSATHYQTSGTLGTFPASSSLKLLQYTQMGLYSDTRYTTLPMTGSNVSVMFGAQTGNTSGTYSVVFRNLRVEYRKRGGGTYVTGSFVYNYGGGGYWTNPVLDLINTTGSVSLTNGNLMVTGSVGATLGFIGNLTGTASYAAQAATASYVLQAVSASYASTASYVVSALTASYVLQAISASYASYAVTASQADVATNALNANTASYLIDTGFSGSLTRLKDGTSYLLAGPNITITTNSNGAVAISASLAGATNYWQSNVASIIFTTGSVDITGSLVVSGSITGSNIVLNGANSKLSAPNGDLIISASNHIFMTGSLIVSGSRSDSGTETSSTLFNGDIFVSGGIGTNDYIQLKPVNLLRIPTNTTASYLYTSGSDNDMYFTQYRPETNIVNTVRFGWLEGTLSTGLLFGGVLTTATGSTTFSMTSGSGLIINNNATTNSEPYPIVKHITWPTSISESLHYVTSSQTTYIGINDSGGIIQQTVPFGARDSQLYIPVGRILHQSSSVTNGTLTQPNVAYGLVGSHDIFVRAFGPLKLSGHILAASGSTLGITKTSGESYTEGKNYSVNPSSPDLVLPITDGNITVSKIFRVYVSGSTFNIDSGIANAGYTEIDPGHYNNNGVLDNIASGKYSIQRVYWFPNSVNKAYFVYYGGAIYNSLDLAQSAIPSEVLVEGENTINAAILVGYIIAKGDATNLSNIVQARIVQGPLFRSAAGGGGRAGGITVAAGLDTYVQFNDGGSAFGGVANLTFDKVTNTITTTNLAVSNIETVGGNVTLGNATSDIVYISGSLTASNGLLVTTGSITSIQGFSGSLTKLTDGSNYLLAGPNIIITTSSNGSIQISGSQPDPDLIYWTSNIVDNIFTTGSVDITGSLVASGSIRALTGFTGSLLGTASYATQAATASYVLQAVSASYAYTASLAGIATSSLNANTASYLVDTGFSGSLTRLKDGTPYLLAGPNITIITSSNGSIQISSSQADLDPAYWISNVAGNIFTTGSVDITGSLVASGSIQSITGFTGSLLGTASYATQAATASYVLQAVSASYAYTASLAGIATSSLNANTASYLIDTGFSGSLTRLKDGTLYLVAGPNITITTNSNGAIAISSSQADLDVNYWTSNVADNIFTTGSVDITGSLVSSGSIRALTGFTGSLLGTASYASQAATASYVLQAVSASYAYTASLAGIATSSLNANTASYLVDTGFSGSLTRLKDGTLYLIAGPNVTITTNSNGSVAITGSAGSSSPQYWISPYNNFIYTTGSVEIYNGLSITGSLIQGTGNGASLVGQYAHAQGDNTVASGLYSHAEGTKDLLFGPVASGTGSHAEGYDQTEASGTGAHAEGSLTLASGFVAHSEGWSTVAAGIASHAEGQNTAASGSYAHAEGIGTIASGSGQLTVGRYNKRGNDFSLFVIGDGTADADASRGDIVRVNSGSAIGNGRVEITGSIVVTNGISGSLTKLKDGTSYLIAGTSITITTGSSGAVTIASTGGTVNTGSTSLDFGLAPGTNIVSASVTGQASIVAGSQINAWIAASTTATHNMTEHLLAPIVVKCGPATAGSGFIIYAYSEIRMTGVFTVQWFWN
jgi:fatty acid-binding protein DegV